MLALLIMILIPLAGFSLGHKVIHGRIPRPIFRWFLGWWWPHRPAADAGALLADGIFAAPNNFKTGWESIEGKIGGKSISVSLRETQYGRAAVRVHNVRDVPISAWGDYRLNQARRWLEKRKKRKTGTARSIENEQRYIDGTRLTAQLLAEEFGQRKALPIESENIRDFDTAARFMELRYGSNDIDRMLTVEQKPRIR